MEDFISYYFDVSAIIFAIRVGDGQGDRIHRNRPSHGLVYLLDGENTYRFNDGQTESVHENQLFYLPKCSSYEVIPKNSSCIAINFLLRDESVTFPFFKLSSDISPRYEKFFTAIEQLWKWKPHGYSLKCKSLLYDLLYNIQKNGENAYLPETQRARLNAATEYIRQHYLAEKIPVPKLAEIAGITPEYLRKLFQKAYQTSPQKYIANLKIQRAKELLRAGEFSTNEVAELCGYNSAGFFCREFKKEVCLTPATYKKRFM